MSATKASQFLCPTCATICKEHLLEYVGSQDCEADDGKWAYDVPTESSKPVWHCHKCGKYWNEDLEEQKISEDDKLDGEYFG